MTTDKKNNQFSRREFIETTTLAAGVLSTTTATDRALYINENMNRAMDTKLGVLPVFPGLVHHGIYEGPCRTGSANPLTTEQERSRNIRLAKEYGEKWQKYPFNANVKILDHVYLEYDDSWAFTDKQFAEIEKNIDKIDVFLLTAGSGLGQIPAVKIGERFKKPVIFYGGCEHNKSFPEGIDAVSHLRASNLEGHVAIDRDELDRLFHHLQVKKAVSYTRLLRVTENKTNNVNGNFVNIEHLKKKFGIQAQDVPIHDLVVEFDRVSKDKNEQQKVKALAQKWIENADSVHMKHNYVESSVNFCIAVQNLMKRHGCNAFTIHCFEMCPDQRLTMKRKATPCLTHTILRDMGIPTACEADMNLLMTVMFTLYLTRKSMYMGNLYVKDRKQNILEILHDVPGLKMKGFDQPDLPYELRNFTFSGFGATVRYDFNRDQGQDVTIARFDPSGNRILVTEGIIAGGDGMDKIGCSLRAYIKIKDLDSFFHKAADFGNHSVMVYGSFMQEFKELGKLAAIEIVEA